VQNAEWRRLHAEKDSLEHQGREISASRVLEIIAISLIFRWKLPQKGGSYITFFRNFSAENFFSTKSLFFSTIFTLHFLAKLLHFTNENTKAQTSNYKI
jgi:hypothetical protein